MDIIFIRDLRIDTVIGIYDWERSIKQTLRFDLEMATDIARAAASDSIDDTLNYKGVAKRIIQFVSDFDYHLIETLAERVAEIVLTEFDVEWHDNNSRLFARVALNLGLRALHVD